MHTISAIAIATKISYTEKTHDTDNILNDLLVYDKNNWYCYDTSACIYFADVIELFLNKFSYIATGTDGIYTKIYTKIPGAVIRNNVNINTPYSNLKSIQGIIFSNVAVFLLITSFTFRLIMYVDPKYLDLYKSIPYPETLIEYQLTSRTNFDEPSSYYFIDKNL